MRLAEFENDVILYGSQTGALIDLTWSIPFENDVILYGSQTFPLISPVPSRLRMM